MNGDERRQMSHMLGDMLSGGRHDVTEAVITAYLETSEDVKIVAIAGEPLSGRPVEVSGFARALPGILGTLVYIPGIPTTALKPSTDESAHALRRNYQARAAANQARKV